METLTTLVYEHDHGDPVRQLLRLPNDAISCEVAVDAVKVSCLSTLENHQASHSLAPLDARQQEG